ncbi:MAG TPA: hypothetical protein VGF23_21580 [Gaiellaceae bacterium]
MSRRIALIAAVALTAAGLAVPAASASPHMLVGFNDEANILYGNPQWAFPLLKQLRTQVLRVNLYWGGTKWAVATKKPNDPTDPGDPAYNWDLYDRLVRYAAQYNVKIMFSILFTPGWANGNKARTYPPTNYKWLRDFAYAAAERYSGFWKPPTAQQDPGNDSTDSILPKVSMWTAWNEPNNPIWLSPQYKKVKGKYVIESAREYVQICRAISQGVHGVVISPERGKIPGEKVACGVTGPRGNNSPRSFRPSVDPMAFMRALKRDGLKAKDFDVYAHHPYYGNRTETPSTKPKSRTAIELGNINTLLAQIKTLWGPKHLWITEYGYQTRPQDRLLGVTYAQQAAYLKQAFAIARKNPRIDLMLWFLLKDEPASGNWQSGLMTYPGKKKPAFVAFQRLPH